MSVRIRRVTTTRAGGVSAPPFDTFNLGDHVGDDPAAVAANRARLAAAIGLGADRVVWMNQVHGDRVEVVDEPRAIPRVDDTDALVTSTPRLALAVVTADCVPVLLADARAGVVARRARRARRRAAGGGGPRGGGDAGAGRARRRHLGCCSARRSAVATTRCPRRWPTRSRRRCRAAAPPPRPARRDSTFGPESLASYGFGCHGDRHRSALHGGRPDAVQPSPGRADRAAGVAGVDGMTAMAVDMPARAGDRESELTHALAAVRSRLAAAAEAAGRNVSEIELLPDYQILSGNRCRDFVAIGLSGCRRIARAGSGGEGRRSRSVVSGFPRRRTRGIALAHGGPDSAQQGPVAGPLGAYRPFGRQRAAGDGAGSGGGGGAGRGPPRSDPLRVYVQVSLDGDVSRGGVDVADARRGRRVCAQVEAVEEPGTGRVDGHPAAGLATRTRPSTGCDRSTAGCCEAHPNAVGLSAGMSSDLEIAVKHGSTCVRVGTALLGPRPLPSP